MNKPGPVHDVILKERAFEIIHHYAWPSAIYDQTTADFQELITRKEFAEEFFIYKKLNLLDGNLDVLWLPSTVYDLYVSGHYPLRDLDFNQVDSYHNEIFDRFLSWFFKQDISHDIFIQTHRNSKATASSIRGIDYTDLMLRAFDSFFAEDWRHHVAKLNEHFHKNSILTKEKRALQKCFVHGKNFCASMLVTATDVELVSRLTNKFPLFRFTLGVSFQIQDSFSELQNMDNNGFNLAMEVFSAGGPTKVLDMVDFPGLKSREGVLSLSFSYTIMSGIVRDAHPTCGACTYILCQSSHYRCIHNFPRGYTYALLLDREWVYTQASKYFHLPSISYHNSPFGKGETFHPRSLSFKINHYKSNKELIHNWDVSISKNNLYPVYFKFADMNDFMSQDLERKRDLGIFGSKLDVMKCFSNFSTSLNKIFTENMILLDINGTNLQFGRRYWQAEKLIQNQKIFGLLYEIF